MTREIAEKPLMYQHLLLTGRHQRLNKCTAMFFKVVLEGFYIFSDDHFVVHVLVFRLLLDFAVLAHGNVRSMCR